jgi:hypothetical protein
MKASDNMVEDEKFTSPEKLIKTSAVPAKIELDIDPWIEKFVFLYLSENFFLVAP